MIPVKGSLVDMARDGNNPNASASIFDSTVLQPGRRGSHSCPCYGEVLAVFEYYGWLKAYGKVNHPAIAQNNGRICIGKGDIGGGNSLRTGDIVSFYLCLDADGLGAEGCRVERSETAVAPCLLTLPEPAK